MATVLKVKTVYPSVLINDLNQNKWAPIEGCMIPLMGLSFQ